MQTYKIFTLLSHILFTLSLGYYLITNLQWYNYKLSRVIFKHKKYEWHILYFLLPIFAYYVMSSYGVDKYFWIYFYASLPALYLWQKGLDKKLVFTPRVKRFFLFLTFSVVVQNIVCFILPKCEHFGVVIPLFIALGASFIYEKIQFLGFKKSATKKLESIPDLKIVAITASYGKTSIKNFLHQILSSKYKTYMTPRSINTLGGLMKDINDDLPQSTEIYIAEAGARVKGDIDEIARFLNHHYAIVGSIGEQHIEYFNSLENIRNTKMEILNSKNLKKTFVHTSANVKENSSLKVFGDDIENISSTLDGLSFDVMIDGELEHFNTPLLGAFNAINLTASIHLAYELGMSLDEIKKALLDLDQVEHRLQKIEAGGKIIIDDSFNGNFDGMSASYDLVSSYDGRKVVVTPGIIESTKERNIELAKKIDEVFDLVIITGTLNAQTLYTNIKNSEKILLKDKSKLQDTLASKTKVSDLILFSNDAPTFI